MWLLLLTSMVGLTFIIERGMALRWQRVIPDDVAKAIDEADTPGGLQKLRTLAEARPSALSRILIVALDHLHWPKAETVDSIETKARHEVNRLERGLVVLEIVVGIAPLLGLVGTIHGLITLFGDLGQASGADNTVLAKGIAIALNTTLAGLLIAIPALVAWSYYNKRIENMAVELETLADQFMRQQHRDATADRPVNLRKQ